MFEENQIFKFDVFDVDDLKLPPSQLDLRKQDYIGSVETALAVIAASPSKAKSYKLMNRSKPNNDWGVITVQVEELSNQNADVTFDLCVDRIY